MLLCAVISAVGMPFTTMNVLRAVREVEDTNLLGKYLGVPESKREEIRRFSKFSSVVQQRKALINYFIENDPESSWRSVICTLDRMLQKEIADDIRHLAEPVPGR